MSRSDKSALFGLAWRAFAPDGPDPVAEYPYNRPDSKHRFDWAFPDHKVAVEVDGGQWSAGGGRHNRDSDRHKLNIAAALGWRVYRFSPDVLQSDPWGCVNLVKRGLGIDHD